MEREIIQDLTIPVIAIDGGAAVGKGAVRQILAEILGFRSLDSGVLYRVLGLLCYEEGITETVKMAERASQLNLRFDGEDIWVDNRNRTKDVRSELGGNQASIVSKILEVREALLHFQLGMRQSPGLVADGRDMGDIFEKSYRYFLETEMEVKAERRVKQLKRQGQSPNYQEILEAIKKRDHEDQNRKVSPLKPHPDALIINTSYISAQQVAKMILHNYEACSR